MENKRFNKRTLFIILGLLSIGILTVIGTYAYFYWSSASEEADATISVTSVNGLGQCNKTSDNQKLLWPVSSRNNGRIVRVNAKQTLSEYAYIVWTLTIDSINTSETETVGLKHQSFKYELVNTTTGVSYGSGNFQGLDEDDTITFSNNIENLAYNKNYIFTLYLWIDGTLGVNPSDMIDQTYEFSLVCDITGEPTNKVQTAVTAAAYISNLYYNAEKTTAMVDSITYNLAPSVGLMNDRNGSMDADIDGGNIRYFGSSPNNYVWLGDTFTSTYTYTSNGSTVTRNAGDRKLWRIIGVFDGRLKLVSDDIITPNLLSWNSINKNEWPEAALMKLLNPGYENESVNNSLYWNKSSGIIYSGNSESTVENVSFANTGLSSEEKGFIDDAVWTLGASKSASYASSQYISERQSDILGNGNHDHCKETCGYRSESWIGKVGIMYLSDYGYATDFRYCSSIITSYNNTNCGSNDWLRESSEFQWTLSPKWSSTNIICYCHGVYRVNTYVNNMDNRAEMGSYVRSVIYLKPEVTIASGSGTDNNPYILSYQ